ncbi:MAG: RnfABCDGE type electron transport complex subunit D [Ruminiclostridium sp.]|nr:RnfABCDGE type electron transport complex subunit D [Ruminiclostridium sp.]
MSEKTTRAMERFDSDLKTYTPEKKQRKLKSIYADQLIFLIALAGLGVWQSGLRALVICLTSVLTCMLTDAVFCRMSGKTYNPRDLSTIASGLCLALMMPASVSYGIVFGGGLLAMGIKHIFGGKDNYIFNPTCAAIAFLIICFPQEMLLYPQVGVQPEVFGTATGLVQGIESYLLKIGTAPSVFFTDMLIGNYVGPLGTTHFLVLLVSGVCLLARRSMSGFVTVFGLGSYFALTAIFPVYTSIGDTIKLELMGGYLLFGFIFLASDPQTVPRTVPARIVYGLLIGIIGCLFRHFGKVEGSFIFILLIANAVSVHLDVLCAAALRGIRRGTSYMFRNMGRFERLRENAAGGKSTRRLTDTMEIIVPPTNYNMPPIDGKVTKIRRKKTGFLSRQVDNFKIRLKKEELIRRKKEKEQERANYMAQMRKMQKTPDKAEKTASAMKKTAHPIKQPASKSQEKHNKQGQK